MNKIYGSPQEAIADIKDGSSIMIQSFVGALGIAQDLIAALLEKGTKDLDLICCANPSFVGGTTIHKDWKPYLAPRDLIREGRCKKATFCWGKSAHLNFPGETGSIWDGVPENFECEFLPMGTLAHRIRAAGNGIGAFYSPVGAGTWYAEGKESRVINGVEYVLEYPLTAEFGFIKASKVDTFGNIVYRRGEKMFGPLIAKACKTVIVQADEIVEAGEIEPDQVMTPGIYVDRIVLRKKEDK